MTTGWGGNDLSLPEVKKRVMSMLPLLPPQPSATYTYRFTIKMNLDYQ